MGNVGSKAGVGSFFRVETETFESFGEGCVVVVVVG